MWKIKIFALVYIISKFSGSLFITKQLQNIRISNIFGLTFLFSLCSRCILCWWGRRRWWTRTRKWWKYDFSISIQNPSTVFTCLVAFLFPRPALVLTIFCYTRRSVLYLATMRNSFRRYFCIRNCYVSIYLVLLHQIITQGRHHLIFPYIQWLLQVCHSIHLCHQCHLVRTPTSLEPLAPSTYSWSRWFYSRCHADCSWCCDHHWDHLYYTGSLSSALKAVHTFMSSINLELGGQDYFDDSWSLWRRRVLYVSFAPTTNRTTLKFSSHAWCLSPFFVSASWWLATIYMRSLYQRLL